MPRQYLDVPYKSKDAAKALGARFDGMVKRWYVEDGLDLVAFTTWLPAGSELPLRTSSVVTFGAESLSGFSSTTDLATVPKGIPLSHLLNSVSAAVVQAFDGGIWTLVEVNEASVRNGHVYLEVSERDTTGQPVARAKAMIWASTATRILPEFEQATGAVIGAGIKLLVRAKPVFKAQYGFSLEIDAIDPEYTLGDLEARKKEIRARLQHEGVFDHNRQLAAPWDYRLVLVVAPQEAAGLGDFQKEAERLTRFGICQFVYAHSRFQGEGAAREIVAAASTALQGLDAQPDAIVILRGGGAVNDLAWLNDYELARFICDQTIPVLTGIGHERDSTVPDEVAHTRFDTPSKVIAGIEQQILCRSREAQQAWEAILSDARNHLVRARQDNTAALNDIAVTAVRQVHDAARQSLALLNQVRADATEELAISRQQVPALMTSIRTQALASVAQGRATTCVSYNTVLDRTGASISAARHKLDTGLQRVAERAGSSVQQARSNAQALLREVTGQGPEKTLARGFAIVRTHDGKAITTRQQAIDSPTLRIQFRDGATDVRTDPTSQEKKAI